MMLFACLCGFREEADRTPVCPTCRAPMYYWTPPSARPIGELIKPIMERAETMATFQDVLSRVEGSSEKKRFIMAAREAGALDSADAELLIQAMMLETA